ncbi:hypothetical protein [Comamonas sp. C11]|uniref:hypothetical protein n=1 Tax=Comamonas sp. C11 TaxID=2966554 RepID=UPI002111A2F5|nr:hypothetical protein [Comamonas sp. C11]UUC95995.1 hypothetical protein NOX35_12205 [Comamonas sp. C11]
MFDLIGSVRDLFSSPYNNHPIASEGIIVKLWCSLFDVFIDDTDYDNQFDALSTMSDILMYAKRQHIELNLNHIKNVEGKA